MTVRRRCVKILQQIFSMEAREAALPYIHTAAPIVIRSLLSDQVSRVHRVLPPHPLAAAKVGGNHHG